MSTQIKIEDYSLTKGEIFAQVSIPSNKPSPNFFNISFDEWDVISAAISLGIINTPDDYDNGRNGQQLRLGYYSAVFPWQQYNKELKMPMYFPYQQIEKEFSGEDREAIVMHIAMQDAQIENVFVTELL